MKNIISSPPFDAYNGSEPFVFISYAHLDKGIVYPLLFEMHKTGVRMWYDEGIPPSEKWKKIIAEKIRACTVFIVFLTPRAIQSENVLDELYFAEKRYKNKEIQLFSILLEETQIPDEVDLFLGRIQAFFRFTLTDAVFFRKLYQVLNPIVLTNKNQQDQLRDSAFERVDANVNQDQTLASMKAVEEFQQAQIDFKKQGEFAMVGFCNELIAKHYLWRQNYPVAEEYFLEAIKFYIQGRHGSQLFQKLTNMNGDNIKIKISELIATARGQLDKINDIEEYKKISSELEKILDLWQ